MPGATIVVVCVVIALVVALFLLRSKGKATPPPERFEPPREIVARPSPPKAAAATPAVNEDAAPPPPATDPMPIALDPTPIALDPTPIAPDPTPIAPDPTPIALDPTPIAPDPTPIAPDPTPTPEDTAAETLRPPAKPVAPPLPPPRESKPNPPRPLARSYSHINDRSVAEELERASAAPLAAPPPAATANEVATPVDSKMDAAPVDAPPQVAEVNVAVKPSREASATAATIGASTAAKLAFPVNPATADLEKNDPRHAAARRLARVSVSEIKLYHEDEVKAGREAKDLWKRLQQDIALARQTFEARVALEVRERFDYVYDEILRQLAEGDATKLGPDAPAPAPAEPAAEPAEPVGTATRADSAPKTTAEPQAAPVRKLEPESAIPKSVKAPLSGDAGKVAPAKSEANKPTGLAARGRPSNPETAELEQCDPRHAAARRLARLSVSEIKLYHEDEVKAGREAKDLWRRLIADIGLATQTFEKRVDKEVRERFDYLYDEILRQLAEGDASRLGPDAPKPKTVAMSAAGPVAPAAPPPAPTRDAALPDAAPPESPRAAVPVAAPLESPRAAVPVAAPSPTTTSTVTRVAARFAPPTNPATAELEKTDPRHAAARRLARLSVSEIKLYHEDEVKVGREAKDLWKRLIADIGLATQTYEKRVDKEVRERFNYLYDEILRQLAEGDASKLGPDAPKP